MKGASGLPGIRRVTGPVPPRRRLAGRRGARLPAGRPANRQPLQTAKFRPYGSA